VVDALDAVAAETGKSVPQIALNWLLQPRGRSRALPGGARAREGMGTRPGFPSKRPTVASVIIGARDEAQLRDNLGAVGWNLTAAQVARLDAASAITPIYPYCHQWQFKERNPTPVG
jgi:aryl-alcohol dehydrogenase-like predicted oxidoreductase